MDSVTLTGHISFNVGHREMVIMLFWSSFPALHLSQQKAISSIKINSIVSDYKHGILVKLSSVTSRGESQDKQGVLLCIPLPSGQCHVNKTTQTSGCLLASYLVAWSPPRSPFLARQYLSCTTALLPPFHLFSQRTCHVCKYRSATQHILISWQQHKPESSSSIRRAFDMFSNACLW